MLIKKVENMESPRTGNKVANQFIITENGGIAGNFITRETFQSYDSIIAIKTVWGENAVAGGKTEIELDETYWDYSVTTLKYLKEFLQTSNSKKEIEKEIASGLYKLANLN